MKFLFYEHFVYDVWYSIFRLEFHARTVVHVQFLPLNQPHLEFHMLINRRRYVDGFLHKTYTL